MIVSFVKFLMFFYSCFYTFVRIINTKSKIKTSHIIFLVPLLAGETSFLKTYFPELSYFVPVLCFALFCLLLFNISILRALSLALLSYGINLLLYEIILLIVLVCLSPLHLYKSESTISVLTILVSLLQLCLLHIICRSTKFKNGSFFLQRQQAINVGSLLSILCILILTNEQMTDFSLSYIRLFRMLAILLATFVLILWWRTQITKSYRERLRALEVESLRVSKQEQAEYISQLERENERMGRIIHKDNRIVNAMADSIGEYLQYSAYLSGNKLAEKGSSLQAQISEIRYDRQVLLDEKPATPTALPQTGYAGIDAMVTYMAKEASENKINFQFHYGEDFFTESGEDIKETDIVHLLSDSLENAIIATKFAGGKFIELSMLKIKGFPLISISDSGIPFELDTYMNLGLQKASTHLDTGGSGIGLMDLWELKEKYKATLYIDEHPEDANMTKRIVYIFDKKNRYMISTDRFKELQQKQTRADMFVINPNTEAVI